MPWAVSCGGWPTGQASVSDPRQRSLPARQTTRNVCAVLTGKIDTLADATVSGMWIDIALLLAVLLGPLVLVLLVPKPRLRDQARPRERGRHRRRLSVAL